MEKVLSEMSVLDILDSEDFKKELGVQIHNETEHHDKLMREAFTKGLRLQRNPQERLRERDVFNVEDMTAAYKMIVAKMLDGFSSAEREYIKQVCLMAYWRVIEKLKKREKENTQSRS